MSSARLRSLILGAGAVAVAACVALAIVLVARGGEEEPAAAQPRRSAAEGAAEPGRLIQSVYENLLVGRYGHAWDLLHPAHQAIVSRSRYIECAASWPATPDLERFEVLEIYDEPISVPLVPQRISKLVRYRVTVTKGSLSDTFDSTGHAVLVGGKWHWVLAGPDIASFRDGQCPP